VIYGVTFTGYGDSCVVAVPAGTTSKRCRAVISIIIPRLRSPELFDAQATCAVPGWAARWEVSSTAVQCASNCLRAPSERFAVVDMSLSSE